MNLQNNKPKKAILAIPYESDFLQWLHEYAKKELGYISTAEYIRRLVFNDLKSKGKTLDEWKQNQDNQ